MTDSVLNFLLFRKDEYCKSSFQKKKLSTYINGENDVFFKQVKIHLNYLHFRNKFLFSLLEVSILQL